jgi:hypothetical protein
LGVDAAYGYATPSCNFNLYDEITGRLDNADMYFGGFGNQGNGTGIDAGLQVNNDGSVQPFLNVSAFGGYQPIQYNGSQHYLCNNAIGIMYGGIASSGLMFLATGYPNYSPYTYQLPPGSATWTYAAWTFFNPPNDFRVPGNDANGLPSLCATCITKRMTSIAQTGVNFYNSHECYGMCNGNPLSARWDQVVMGELIQPCQNTNGFICTIEYWASNSWLGGYQTYPDQYAVQTNDPNPNQGYEGIDLGQDYGGPGLAYKGRRAASGTFAPLVPIKLVTFVQPCTMPVGSHLYYQGQSSPEGVVPAGQEYRVNNTFVQTVCNKL